jgi:hypothetical protein
VFKIRHGDRISDTDRGGKIHQKMRIFWFSLLKKISTFRQAKNLEISRLNIPSQTPPFSYMNIPKHRGRIKIVFTADNALKYVEFALKAETNSLQLKKFRTMPVR